VIRTEGGKVRKMEKSSEKITKKGFLVQGTNKRCVRKRERGEGEHSGRLKEEKSAPGNKAATRGD